MRKQEILDLASRYVSVENADFPIDGELFYFQIRDVPDNKVLKDNEGWKFSGYAQVIEYVLDTEAKPVGKWVFMVYFDLTQFPLKESSLRLQPPHITSGLFHSDTRSHQISIVKCNLNKPGPMADDDENSSGPQKGNIIPFPKK